MSELMRVGRLSYKGEIAINGEVKKPKRSLYLRKQMLNMDNYIRNTEVKEYGEFTVLGTEDTNTIDKHPSTNHTQWYLKIQHRGFKILFPLNMNFKKNGIVVTPPRPSRKRKDILLYFCTAMQSNEERHLHIGNATTFDDGIYTLSNKELTTLYTVISQICMEYYILSIWGTRKSYFEETYNENTTHIERWVLTNAMAGVLYNWYEGCEYQRPLENLLNYIECCYGDEQVIRLVKNYMVFDVKLKRLETKFKQGKGSNIVLKLPKFSLPTVYGQREVPEEFTWFSEDNKITVQKVNNRIIFTFSKDLVSEICSRRYGSIQGDNLQVFAENNKIKLV